MFVLTVPAAFCVDEILINLVSLNTPIIAPKYVVLVTLVSLNLGVPSSVNKRGCTGFMATPQIGKGVTRMK